ncbi:AbiH family protein [Enterococcus faecalis]|uniref:AbiH family protein n=1 Tax=Enterococcus faecalis TaxID=1351 RepID=UPI003C6C8717
MNITFLLGNGFDIQCGLQTSYIHFYEYILKKKYSLDLSQEMDEKFVSKIDNMRFILKFINPKIISKLGLIWNFNWEYLRNV